jgi:hypothetical protein
MTNSNIALRTITAAKIASTLSFPSESAPIVVRRILSEELAALVVDVAAVVVDVAWHNTT